MRKRVNNGGFTLIELLIVVAIIGVIAAIAVPGLLRARISGYEASAMGSMRAIIGAQSSYAASCGNGFYSPDLANLATGPTGGGDGFIGQDLVGGVKSGYTIAMTAGAAVAGTPPSCNGVAAGGVARTYYASATPVSIGATGNRAFATNQGGTIWQDTAGTAPTEPFAVAGTISPIQ